MNLIKVFIALFLVLMVSGPVYGHDEWTQEDTQRQILFSVVSFIDIGITDYNLKLNPNISEQNPFIGPNPSTERLLIANSAWNYFNYQIARHLDRNWRIAWQWLWITEHLACINGNYRIMIKYNL